ncbi:unnamed protein product [Rotaria sordida]|uniref:Uncharacterized protein n=1 Tax=Rotaria sordida TaxID=392033 RepID=A0A819EDL8_9BILA|nr:unnamed protein product [Rotaria sordida]
MEVCMVNQEKEIDPLLNMFQENSQEIYSNVDYDCLRKYDENNKYFSMAIILENQEGEQQRPIGYDCIYRYGTHRIKLEYYIESQIWKKIPLESNEEQENILNSLFDDNHDIRSLFQSFTLDQQIQIITKRYDKHFAEIDRIKNEKEYENKILLSASIFKEENPVKYVNNDLIELSLHETPKSLIICEDDEQQQSQIDLKKDFVDYGFHSLITGSRSKFSGLAPPPVAPRRSRQNSAFSQCSVRYASFIPPPTAPIRQRRVIESILLHVQRKKKLFEKIVDILKGTEPPTMRQLGLEFLRVYDGKFNYREGHIFFISFRKKIWRLTIEEIKCVDCPAGDIGPRSVLILNYKGRDTNVHV